MRSVSCSVVAAAVIEGCKRGEVWREGLYFSIVPLTKPGRKKSSAFEHVIQVLPLGGKSYTKANPSRNR